MSGSRRAPVAPRPANDSLPSKRPVVSPEVGPAGHHVPEIHGERTGQEVGKERGTDELRLEAGFAADPGRVAYRVVRDGGEVGWWRGPGLVWPVDAPGAYRVEVHRYSARLGRLVWNLRPWIFTNPVLARPATGGA